MSETEGGEEKQVFSYSQIHRKEDLQVCLGEFKEVFSEIQPRGGKSVKYADSGFKSLSSCGRKNWMLRCVLECLAGVLYWI